MSIISRKIKKSIQIILTVILLISIFIPVYAADNTDITLKVNGNTVTFPDAKPFIENSRTLVPIRFVAEALGYNVEWIHDTRTVLIDNGRISMQIDNIIAVIDGKEITLDVAAKIVDSRTFVPLRFVSENLYCSVDWFGENRNIIINANNEDGSEIRLYDRLIQSGLYRTVKPWSGSEYESFSDVIREFEIMFKKDKVADLTDAEIIEIMKKDRPCKWSIELEDDKQGFMIVTRDYSLNTRHEIREVLKVAYPTKYADVYDLVMKSIRQELWETYNSEDGYWDNCSGTFGTHYMDGREVNIYYAYNNTSLTIYINPLGYVNPATPTALSEKEIELNTASGNAHDESDSSKWFMDHHELNIW